MSDDYTPEFKRLGELVAAQQTVKPCPECGGKGHTIGSGILDGKACEACGNTGIAMTHPFPGADAHPAKLGGELCVEGTNLRVRDLLLSLLEWPVAAEAPARKLAADLHVDESLLRSCLRGLADWLKTQDWTGTKPAKLSGTETGRWVCCEELAAFRAWQGNWKVRGRVPDSDVVRDAKARIREALDADFIGELLSDARRIVESDHGTDAMSTVVAREVVRLGKNAFDLWWTWNKEIPQTPATGEDGENCPKCGSSNYGPDGAAMANACWDCGHIVEPEPECCDECGYLPAKGNVVYEDSGRRPLCSLCNPRSKLVPRKITYGGRCSKCHFVFLERGNVVDGRVVCPQCKHSWPIVSAEADRLADLEKNVRQLQGQGESREADEKRAVEKRCGTCEHGQEYRCSRVRVQVVSVMTGEYDREANGGYLTDDDGPPWSDCRFWKPKG